MMRALTPLVYAIAAIALAGQGAAHALVPIGPEFQVTSFTSSHQAGAQVAITASGSFVVIWNSLGQEGSPAGLSGLFGRRYDSTGAPLASEFQVNTRTFEHQTMPAISTDASGRFVVAWNSNGQDGDYRGVFAQPFDSGGSPVGAEFQVALQTVGIQDSPDVAMTEDGAFFVVWTAQQEEGSEILGRRHDSSGSALAAEFQVNTYTTGYQVEPKIALTAPGELIIVWSSERDGYLGVFGRRLSSSGPQGDEFEVTTYGTLSEGQPAIAPSGDGGFVVVWQSEYEGSATGIFGRSFDSNGNAQADAFLVNDFTVGAQNGADLASVGGEFVATWVSQYQDGSFGGIFARRMTASGPMGGEFRVNIHTPSAQQRPNVGLDEDGDFVVAWESNTQDGSYFGVFARRFLHSDPAVLDVDADGAVGALTDGLLVLRYLFGFAGEVLTGSALGPGCVRCLGTQIPDYLDGLGLTLDVDDDGELDALTDGLLVLRFLFGFTGATLTSGAVADDCMRCDATEIAQYLAGLD